MRPGMSVDPSDTGIPRTPVTPLPGVATVFDVRNTIGADLQRQVALELDKAQPGSTMVALNIQTTKGINLVVASRSKDGHWTTGLWIGKSGWDTPVKKGWEGGVSIRGEWGGAK